ncbi:MAG: elongation factor P [Myxococcales bacterium]|nr:elongation factor P [Myxococcales bacterium]
MSDVREIQVNQIRKGSKIIYDGALYNVLEVQFVKPGKGAAVYKTRMKNMGNGGVREINFRSNEKVGDAFVEERTAQVLYSDGEAWNFMDSKSFEQVRVLIEDLGQTASFLKENIEVGVVYHDNKPIDVTPPNFVDLQITSCEPGVRGNTAQNATKPATLETGAVVNVPLFIEEGEVIRVDTRTAEYVSRVK